MSLDSVMITLKQVNITRTSGTCQAPQCRAMKLGGLMHVLVIFCSSAVEPGCRVAFQCWMIARKQE
jgi:hypothetical protein